MERNTGCQGLRFFFTTGWMMVSLLGMFSERVRPVHAQAQAKSWRPGYFSEDELKKQLDAVPEVSVPALKNSATAKPGVASALRDGLLRELVAKQPELGWLPLRKGPDCQLLGREAKGLLGASQFLRAGLTAIEKAKRDAEPDYDGPPDGAFLSYVFEHRKELTEDMAPTLQQVLTAEGTLLREFLVETLGKIKTREASVGLAKRALYDLSPAVRGKAIAALKGRPSKDYVKLLVDGLRYPWAPVAGHAAEALMSLELSEVTPQLEALVRAGDPTAPVSQPSAGKSLVVREMVRLNHLRNCMLCHTPSHSDRDVIRGRVPDPSKALPPASEIYGGSDGNFVRADVTYLQQDFSLVQRVANPAPWPAMQRFDFLVRTRPARASELNAHESAKTAAANPTLHRQILTYTLDHFHHLAGKTSSESKTKAP